LGWTIEKKFRYLQVKEIFRFPQAPRLTLGIIQPPSVFREADRSPQFNTDIQNAWS
jgi:hypothetical protein